MVEIKLFRKLLSNCNCIIFTKLINCLGHKTVKDTFDLRVKLALAHLSAKHDPHSALYNA